MCFHFLGIKRFVQCLVLFLFLMSTLGCQQTTQQENPPIDITSLLNIFSPNGINCPPQGWSVLPQALTFATDRRTYKPEEITEMANYIEGAYDKFAIEAEPEYVVLKTDPLPTTLQYMQASLTKNIGGWNLYSSTYQPGCIGYIEITNLTNEMMTFHGINIRLLGAPKVNTGHYHLINICSLPFQPNKEYPDCPAKVEEQPWGSDYTFSLTNNLEQQIITGVATRQLDEDYKPATRVDLDMEPGELLHWKLNIQPPKVDGNLVYRIVPELVITLSDKEQIIPLNDLETTLVFANPDQVSCYSLQGGTFIAIEQDGVGMDYSAAPSKMINNNIWCL